MAERAESDEALVEGVCLGRLSDFAVLIQRHNRGLYRLARAIVKDDHEAEDVVQQTHLSAYLHLHQFEGRAKFSTWIARIATNESLARLRSRARGALSAEDPEAGRAETTERDPEDLAAQSELSRALEAAVESLPMLYRVAFVLRHVEGLDTGEAAAWLGVTEQTLRVRVHRARMLLRTDVLARVDGGAEELFSFGGVRCARIARGVLLVIATPAVVLENASRDWAR